LTGPGKGLAPGRWRNRFGWVAVEKGRVSDERCLTKLWAPPSGKPPEFEPFRAADRVRPSPPLRPPRRTRSLRSVLQRGGGNPFGPGSPGAPSFLDGFRDRSLGPWKTTHTIHPARSRARHPPRSRKGPEGLCANDRSALRPRNGGGSARTLDQRGDPKEGLNADTAPRLGSWGSPLP